MRGGERTCDPVLVPTGGQRVDSEKLVEGGNAKTECDPFDGLGYFDLAAGKWVDVEEEGEEDEGERVVLPGRLRRPESNCASKQPLHYLSLLKDPTTSMSSLSFLRNRFILFVGDSQDRNAIDRVCALAHPSLNPQLSVYQWNGTRYPDSVVKSTNWGTTPDLPAHAHPHKCTLKALNATFINYFHLGVRMTPYYDKSNFLGPNETAHPVDRIKTVLIPFLHAINITSSPDLILTHSLLWDLRSVPLKRISEYLPLYSKNLINNLFIPLAETFPQSHFAWRTVPLSSPTHPHFPQSAIRLMNTVAKGTAKSVGMNVVDWESPLVGRHDLLWRDGFHQNEEGLNVLVVLVLHSLNRLSLGY
ncbi:hypothetical protein HK104_000942 [Borealophlyctis nickersoniae]|nr:hypothetical protein HK104_000942 [Borealophlyctis nickersoniae]